MPGFQEEWELCLDGEVSAPLADLTLPIVLSRHQILDLTGVDDLYGLALRTLYATALRPAKLFELGSQHLSPAGLLQGDRLLPLDPVTAAALGALALVRPQLFQG